jgi:hypothetical protein
LKYFNVFLNLKTFKNEYAPFVERMIGPSWFVQPFPPIAGYEESVSEQWLAYLDPTVLSCRIGVTSKDYGLVGYFPNLVSRQFGLTQLIPKSFYGHERDICLGYKGITEGYFRSYLKNTEKHTRLPLFHIKTLPLPLKNFKSGGKDITLPRFLVKESYSLEFPVGSNLHLSSRTKQR